MLKIFKNLKKSFVMIIVIILLLIVQAMADLRLPEYTSKIVNTGIQSSGIENVAPEVIRQSQMEKVLSVTKDDEEILRNYELVKTDDNSKEKYDEYLKEYPELENQNLYILKDNLNKEEIESLNELMAKPLVIVSFIDTNQLTDEMTDEITSENKDLVDIVIKEIKDKKITDLSIYNILNILPEETSSEIIDKINTEIDKKVGNMLSQAAITVTKAEYEACRIDMEKYQITYLTKTGLQMLSVALISMAAAVTIMLLSSKVACSKTRSSFKRKDIYKSYGFFY